MYRSVVVASLLSIGSLQAVHAGPPVAGVSPYQRPDGAPVVSTVQKGPKWYARALTGVEPPYPHSLRFLEDQGNWYTPFNHPGMRGPYDIRHWHQR